jgi:hypothetical protein
MDFMFEPITHEYLLFLDFLRFGFWVRTGRNPSFCRKCLSHTTLLKNPVLHVYTVRQRPHLLQCGVNNPHLRL